jgi:hypothetical protein
VTLPRLKGIYPRYCSRSDDEPAAKLAVSMLRLGISRVSDWSGSAVDFVSKGLARFCRSHRLSTVNRVFPQSCIQLLDEILERNEYERSQSEDSGPSSRMFLTVNYEQAAMLQIGPTLSLLEQADKDLPAAFFMVLAKNLGRWMRVYDYRDAEFEAEDQIGMMEEEDLKESFYPQVKSLRPGCLKTLPKYKPAVKYLQEWLPKCAKGRMRFLIRSCLDLHAFGERHELPWPSDLRDRVPEMDDYLEHSDYPGPGALIVFEEEDLIEACFTEEMQYLGQNYMIGSTAMLLIALDQNPAALDREVKAAFAYLGAMLRSLAVAAELIEMIRGVYDENLRQRRLESRVQAEQSVAGVR